MAMTKKSQSKSAGKFAVKGGGKGGMHNFEGVGAQKPGVSSVSKGSTSGKFAKGGPSGKMQKFSGTKPQKSGRSRPELMASGFTQPNEKLGRAGLNAIVAKVKGSGATVNDYARPARASCRRRPGRRSGSPDAGRFQWTGARRHDVARRSAGSVGRLRLAP